MPDYRITRDKLMMPEEVGHLLSVCGRRASIDLAGGRKGWVNRHMLVYLACGSGLRAAEIATLKIGDLHLSDGAAYLSVSGPEGKHARQVVLGRGLTEHLRDYLAIKERTWGEPLHAGALLLPGRSGDPYTSAALGASFKKALAAAGLSKTYSLRSARHAYSAFLLATTSNLRYVQKQMGHANQSMTLLYQDVAPCINLEAASSLIG
jgi:site-specific recombinase XerD